jgi:hypothetical protein
VGAERIKGCVREMARRFGWKPVPSTIAPAIGSMDPQVAEADWAGFAAEVRDYEMFSNDATAPEPTSHERSFHL